MANERVASQIKEIRMNKKCLRVAAIGWPYDDETPFSRSVAYCDVRQERVDAWCVSHPDMRGVTDWRSLLNDDGIDAVVIAVPNHLHCEMGVAFLEAGKHVFLEKPMGVNRAEMDRLLAASRATDARLAIDFEYRFSSGLRRVQNILESGELGQPRGAQVNHYQGQWQRLPGAEWRLDPDRSGGVFFECICHFVDLLRCWLGEVEAVQCVNMPVVLPQYSERMPDNATCHLFFRGGAVGMINTVHSMSVEAAKHPQYNDLNHSLNIYVSGTEGCLRLDIINHRLLVMAYEPAPNAPRDRVVALKRVEYLDGANPFHDIVNNRRRFLQAFAEGTPLPQTPEDAYESFSVCLAIEQSRAEQGRRVAVR